ncbi:hypothetical protein QL285_058188 [Trifolium repens]|nr:hypothetical protein QL285_058188 [Trifolium repens]
MVRICFFFSQDDFLKFLEQVHVHLDYCQRWQKKEKYILKRLNFLRGAYLHGPLSSKPCNAFSWLDHLFMAGSSFE